MVEKILFGDKAGLGESARPAHPRRCETCAHWEPPDNPNREVGACTHELPNVALVPNSVGQLAALTYFPQTKPAERCGKWERKTPIEN